jgi:RHS repeat-associated protein
VLTNEVRYLYDGDLVIQERNNFNLPLVSYVRGSDLSGTIEGAGGIGGLLARMDHSTINPQLSTAYFHADGNGNVTTLVDANQQIAARYVYDPFGAMLSIIGPLAEANLYRFSSKESHLPSGLVHYQRRYYETVLQRWMSRDPIAENGGINLYAFVNNRPTTAIDTDGRSIFKDRPRPDTSIRKCNRKIENPSNDPIIGLANARGHDYFDWPDGAGGRDGVGFNDPGGKDGDLPGSEKGATPRSCRPCYKTGAPLKDGKVAGKKGKDASDAEIQDCLKNRPIKGNYEGLRNNCNDWANGAADDCGIDCP